MKKLTDHQKIEIVEKYIAGQSSVQLSLCYNVSKHAILSILKTRNIPRRDRGSCRVNRVFKLNERYFEVVDTEDKAYFLGFMYADGCVTLKQSKYLIMTISLQDRDKHILESFKRCMQFEGNISLHKARDCNSRSQFCISISSKKLCTDLIKLGCNPRKTFTLKFPTEEQVPSHLIHHFIRGFFDGDGTLAHKSTEGTKILKWGGWFVGHMIYVNKLTTYWLID